MNALLFSDHCGSSAPNCQNGGFVSFQCKCICPDGLTGALCEQTVSNSGKFFFSWKKYKFIIQIHKFIGFPCYLYNGEKVRF